MDRNAKSSSVPPVVVQPETVFTEFFEGVISKLYDLKNRQILNDVRSALGAIRRLKHKPDNFHTKTYFSFKPPNTSFSFRPPQVRCAYLYAYSVLHSIMVYFEFSNLLKQCKMFLLPACRRDSLKICCLGGGPGIEAVAICRSIHDMIIEPYLTTPNSSLDVYVTMIDKLPHWRREESAVVNAINDSLNVFHSERLNFHSDFMRADLLKPFENSLREKIMESDIVTIVKLVCSIQEISPESCVGELQFMMENVIESMREDSCLFMLDAAGGNVFYSITNILRDKGLHSRFKISKHKQYNLDKSTIKKLEDMMKLKKHPNNYPIRPTVMGKVSACMWVKNTSIIPDNADVPNKNNADKMSNISNSFMQGEKVTSSATHSNSDLKTSNDVLVTTDTAKNTELAKKSKRALKKEMKRKKK